MFIEYPCTLLVSWSAVVLVFVVLVELNRGKDTPQKKEMIIECHQGNRHGP